MLSNNDPVQCVQVSSQTICSSTRVVIYQLSALPDHTPALLSGHDLRSPSTLLADFGMGLRDIWFSTRHEVHPRPSVKAFPVAKSVPSISRNLTCNTGQRKTERGAGLDSDRCEHNSRDKRRDNKLVRTRTMHRHLPNPTTGDRKDASRFRPQVSMPNQHITIRKDRTAQSRANNKSNIEEMLEATAHSTALAIGPSSSEPTLTSGWGRSGSCLLPGSHTVNSLGSGGVQRRSPTLGLS